MESKKEKRSIAVHDGPFHADEVCACALLILANLADQDKIIRSRDEAKLERAEFVCDVGGIYDEEQKRFDHHQSSYTGPLSSAGMILSYLKKNQLLDEELCEHLNESLIKGVDAHDTGMIKEIPLQASFSLIISNFSPVEYNPPTLEEEKAFHEAVDFSLSHLRRLWARFEVTRSYREIVKTEMDKGQEVLYFSQALPWLPNFFALGGEQHPAKFVIMPAAQQWKLRAIPPSLKQRMQVRLALPEKWAGLLDEELQAVSKIPGAVFCHKGRFISVWETRADALCALEYCLKEANAHD